MKKLILTLWVVPIIAFGQVLLTTAQIAKKVSPSVVVIRGKTDSGDVLGSGFIVSKDGTIVTNLHVIRDMNTANIQLADGQVFDSLSVLAVDEPRDLAVIKIAGFNLPALGFGKLRYRPTAIRVGHSDHCTRTSVKPNGSGERSRTCRVHIGY